MGCRQYQGAMKLVACSKILIKRCIMTCLLMKSFSHTLNCEDTLLSLASCGEVDGVFYANILKMELGDSLLSYVCGVFEYGCFNGFGQTCVDKMKC